MTDRQDLSRLLRPRSIAVFGSHWAANVVEQCRRIGFGGSVWPVHPKHGEIAGLPAYPSVADLPGTPDAAFVGVNRDATIEVVSALAKGGAGGAVCFASGWSESGADDRQARLVDAAGEMPVLGPNCYGFINLLDRALLWPDQHGARPARRGVAIIAQSSNVAISLTMQARALPIAYVVCVGNGAQTGIADLAEALLDDDRVTALGLYVEGMTDAARIAGIAMRAREERRGIVALKTGKTPESRAAAASHTAALVGDAVHASAFFDATGIGEVETPEAFLEALKILHVHGPLPGRHMCSLSCSGGEAALVSDLASNRPLTFPEIKIETGERLSRTLGPLVSIANPLDYHTFIWGDRERTTDVFSTLLADHDAGIFMIDPPRADRCDPASFMPALQSIEAAGRITGKPAFPVASIPENFDEKLAVDLMERGCVPLMGLDTALSALSAASAPAGRPGWRPLPPSSANKTRLLQEDEAKALLREAGIPIPNGVSARSLESLAEAAAILRPPLVLKGLGLAHKSEAGAVRLDLASLDGETPMPGVAGYLAEEMVTGAVAELLVNIRRDSIYGIVLTLGAGGVLAELLGDVATCILPVTGETIMTRLGRLRIWPLLDGFRGKPRGDTDGVVEAVLSLQALILRNDRIVEIEINPLIVRENGVVAADALIREEI